MLPGRDITDVEHGESLSPAETRHAPWRLRNVVSTPLADAPFRRYLL